MTAYIITSDGIISFYLNQQMFTVNKTHPFYDKIHTALLSGNDAEVLKYTVIATLVEDVATKYSDNVSVKGGFVFYKNRPVSEKLSNRIISLIEQKYAFSHLINFIENLFQNPSKSSTEELYDFLDHQAIPITDDGCFLSYKAVKNDYYSITAGKEIPIVGKYKEISKGNYVLYNGVGETLELERNAVNDDPFVHCRFGLHSGATQYVKSFGNITNLTPNQENDSNHVVIVKINPKDVVSVPTDEKCQKIRVCKYTVVSELTDLSNLLTRAVYTSMGEDCPHCSDYDDFSGHSLDNDNGDCDGDCDGDCNCEHCKCDFSIEKRHHMKTYEDGYAAGIRDAVGGLFCKYVPDDMIEAEVELIHYISGYLVGYNVIATEQI